MLDKNAKIAKSSKKVLVTGGAGYIGSHTIVELIDFGYEVVSVDNFVNSKPSVFADIKKITDVSVRNYNVDLADYSKLTKVLSKEKNISAVIHFAALKSVPDSVANPLAYYANNLGSTINILKWCKENSVNHFVFSSSCSVYGENSTSQITEETPCGKAFSPYAATKQIGEDILRDFSDSEKKFKSIALRYFNPAGGHESGIIGENACQNIVPIITQIASGKNKKPLQVFGNSYNTRDGSCVRDYVHVSDIAHAHVLALKALKKSKEKFDIINLGAGAGTTVIELVKLFEKVISQKIPYKIVAPRAGDVPQVYADNTKAQKVLGWKPKYSIEKMIETSWNRRHVLNNKKH